MCIFLWWPLALLFGVWYLGSMTNPINTSKSALARLMSTENLKVVYDNQAHTASFNVATRELRLPVYRDFADETNDMFVGHEVGHALYTPASEEEFMRAINAIDPNNPDAAKTFLNVVEDVRIDRLIKTKFPGIRRCYSMAAHDLVKHDLFGLRESGAKPVAEMPIIDRINIHFKAGIYGAVPVLLDDQEQAFADRMEAAETFDDVVQIAKDLYEAMDAMGQMPEPQYVQSPDGQPVEGKGKNGKGNGKGIGNEVVDENAQTSETSVGGAFNNEHNRNRVNPCATQQKYEQLKSRKIDKASEQYHYYEIAKPNLDNIIIPPATILADLEKNRAEDGCKACWIGESLYAKYKQTNLPAVRIMARTFERKQSAMMDSRTLIAKTGIIDPTIVHSYRYNDDIFCRNEELPKGKKHGMVIYIDWSGSMSGTMMATIQQVISLTDFCDMVRIPYEVYAFSSHVDERIYRKQGETGYWHGSVMKKDSYGGSYADMGDNLMMQPFQLFNLLSSNMGKTDRVLMQKHLLVLGAAFDGAMINGERYYFPIPSLYNLGGTPLDEAIVCSFEQIPAFMQKHGVQVMNTVLLTDGGSGSRVVSDSYHNNIVRYNGEDIRLQPCNSYYSLTNSLLGILKRKTGTNIINFELLLGRGCTARFAAFGVPCFTDNHRGLRHRQRKHDHKIVANLEKQYEQKNYAIVENYGNIDAFVMIPGRTGLVESSTFDEQVEGATTIAKIRSAFVKSSSNAVSTRFMLNHMGEVFASQL